MASFQILDLPFEEDLSYDELSNVVGGQEESSGGAISRLINDILSFADETVDQALGTAQDAIDGAFLVLIEAIRTCAASSDPAACLNQIDLEL